MPRLHPNFMSNSGTSGPPADTPNVVDHNFWQKGDVEEGFAKRLCVWHTFRTQISISLTSSHMPPWLFDEKPGAGLAQQQMPFQVRQQLAGGIDAPMEKSASIPLHRRRLRW